MIEEIMEMHHITLVWDFYAEVVVTLHWRRLAMSQAANDLENVVRSC